MNNFIKTIVLASSILAASAWYANAEEDRPTAGDTVLVKLFICDTPEQVNRILTAQQTSWTDAVNMFEAINMGGQNEYGEVPCGVVGASFTFIGQLNPVENVYWADGTVGTAYPVVVSTETRQGRRYFVTVFNAPLGESEPDGEEM